MCKLSILLIGYFPPKSNSKWFFWIFNAIWYFVSELLVAFTSPDDIQIQRDILNRVSSYCNKPVTDYREDEFVNPYQWTFYHCIFFAFIVCSTLGYGNITPSGSYIFKFWEQFWNIFLELISIDDDDHMHDKNDFFKYISGTLGRYSMIAYALVGMPVNMILYTYLGEYFGSKVGSGLWFVPQNSWSFMFLFQVYKSVSEI